MKNGIDYFPFNANFFYDDKVELIEAECGYIASYVAIRLFCKIYDVEGYYCRFGEDERLLFARKVIPDVPVKDFDRVMDSLLNRDIFDAGLYEKHKVLTSRGIQRRFLEGVSRRQRITIIKDYLLVPEDIRKYGNIKLVDLSGNPAEAPQPSSERPHAARAPRQTAQDTEPAPSEPTLPFRRVRKGARKLPDELKILSEFFFRNYLSPEKELQKFINHNEMMNAQTGGWAKMSSSFRLAACCQWKQKDDKNNTQTTVRFPDNSQKEMLSVWQKLFNTCAYEQDAPDDILRLMVADNVKFFFAKAYPGKNDEDMYKFGMSQQLIDYLQQNQSFVMPVLRTLTKNTKIGYYPQ